MTHASLYAGEKIEFSLSADKPTLEDERPYEHVVLCEAAKWGIFKGNVRLLESLLQAGLMIDQPLDQETGWTALHYSAVQNQPRAARFLVANGAILEVRDKHGQRPIDYAFKNGKFELCEILRKPDRKERMLADLPEDLLNELFRQKPDKKDDRVRFLSLNGQDPGDEMLEYFRHLWPNVRPRPHAEEIDRKAQPDVESKTSYRDIKTGDYGIVVEISLEKTSDDSFDWRHREAAGPILAGGGTSGKISKAYGYWIKHDTSGWDE